jgi:DNA-directed RNA polymerase specialized sigma24 family protein
LVGAAASEVARTVLAGCGQYAVWSLPQTTKSRPPAVESDEALWRRSLDGDGEAFGALFDRHRDRVFRHACRLVDARHDAEDVTASAFLELWRRRTDVRLVEGSVLQWLLVTATNLGRNTSRGTRRYRHLLERLPRAEEQADAPEVALGTALGVDARLRAGLRSLNKTDAHLFVLRSCRFGGLSGDRRR